MGLVDDIKGIDLFHTEEILSWWRRRRDREGELFRTTQSTSGHLSLGETYGTCVYVFPGDRTTVRRLVQTRLEDLEPIAETIVLADIAGWFAEVGHNRAVVIYGLFVKDMPKQLADVLPMLLLPSST